MSQMTAATINPWASDKPVAVTTLEDLTPALDPADRATVAQAVALLRTWLSE